MIYISEKIPADGATGVLPSSSVEFRINAGGEVIDLSSLVVLISDNFAVKFGELQDGYDGLGSSITPDGNDYLVSIAPTDPFPLSAYVYVKIQAKNTLGKFYNFSYAFSVVKAEPQLIFSSPKNDDVISLPQMICLHFEDSVDGIDVSTLNIDINNVSYIIDGVVQTSANGSLTEIIDNGDDVIVKIDPSEYFKEGSYVLDYSVEDNSGNVLVGDINFKVFLVEQILPDLFPQTGFLGFYQGIVSANDNGDGSSANIVVSTPLSRSYKSETFIFVYEELNRLDVFYKQPKYILRSDVLDINVENLAPGVPMTYGARAMEVYKDIIDTSGLEELGDGFWLFPQATTITAFVSSEDLVVSVSSTDGYPESGLLIIGSEILRYTSKTANEFIISPNGRGVTGSTIGFYFEDEEVSMFQGCQDANMVTVFVTPTFGDGYLSGREINEIGVNVTDYTDNDQGFFQGFDYCGYHQPLPFRTLNGKDDCGSYLGGEFNGFKGFNLYDQMLNQEEVLLENVGEPVILIKRIWSGQKCSCMNLRKMHPRTRSCGDCYGTGFFGGYDQFSNMRRQDRRIMIKMNESPEDLKLGEKEHLAQEFEPSAWTLAMPAIRDRDLIIRFDFTENREYIYEVLDVSREKMIFRRYGRQQLKLKRLDVTDIVYSYPYTRNF